MTQVGYLDLINSPKTGNDSFDDDSPVMETGGSGSAIVYSNNKMSVGSSHTCAILDDGGIKCWGHSRGTPASANNHLDAPPSTSIDLGAGRTAVAVDASYWVTCVILDNGELVCWGWNSNGQLGNGQNGNANCCEFDNTTEAIDLGPGRTAVAVDTGGHHTCAILDNGELKCWGRDHHGQLGDSGGNTDLNTPPSNAIDLGSGRTAVAVSAGDEHTCAILDNGDLKCWGRDHSGQLGTPGSDVGLSSPQSTPIDFGPGRTAIAVSAGSSHTCAILDNGELKCWGSDNYGQLGRGIAAPYAEGGAWQSISIHEPPSTAVDLGLGRTAVAVAAGSYNTCAILDNGEAKCWGHDRYGQLGIGGGDYYEYESSPPSTPIDFGPGRTAVAIDNDYGHTCAILDNGDLNCWGKDHVGQLGNGAGTTDQGSPVSVSGGDTWDTTRTASSGSGSSNTLTPSVEGADLIIDEAMDDITFQYNASGVSGSGSGSNAGTYNGNGTAWMVENIAPAGTSSFPNRLTAVGNTLFFIANNGQNGYELWKSNGTSSGTVMVKDIYSQQAYSNPNYLTEMGGTLYFSAMDTTNNGHQLWKSDGTESGTVMVTAINSGGTANPGIHTDGFVVMNNNLYFSASDGTNGVELWKSDGTASGTVMVKDINPGSGESFSYTPAVKPVVMNNELYFQAKDGTSGFELWKSDGTASGTVMVKDIYSGSYNGNPSSLTVVGNTLYFSANDGINGVELWKSDGTASGTVMVKDIYSGGNSHSGNPYFFTVVDNTL